MPDKATVPPIINESPTPDEPVLGSELGGGGGGGSWVTIG